MPLLHNILRRVFGPRSVNSIVATLTRVQRDLDEAVEAHRTEAIKLRTEAAAKHSAADVHASECERAQRASNRLRDLTA